MSLPAIIAELVWCVCLVVYLAIRIPRLRRARRQPVRMGRRDIPDWIVRTVVQFSLGVFPAIYIIARFPPVADYRFFPPLGVIGAAVFGASLWIIYRAQNDLGAAFSPSLEIRQQHQLVTTGIYKRIRHPMYLGFLLWAIAQALLLPNWILGIVGLAGWTIFFALRVGREERMMLDEFGDKYRAYAAVTARLVPGLF